MRLRTAFSEQLMRWAVSLVESPSNRRVTSSASLGGSLAAIVRRIRSISAAEVSFAGPASRAREAERPFSVVTRRQYSSKAVRSASGVAGAGKGCAWRWYKGTPWGPPGPCFERVSGTPPGSNPPCRRDGVPGRRNSLSVWESTCSRGSPSPAPTASFFLRPLAYLTSSAGRSPNSWPALSLRGSLSVYE